MVPRVSAAQAPVPVPPGAEALGVVPAEQAGQLLAEHPGQPSAEVPRLVGGTGSLGDDGVDGAVDDGG